MMKKYVENYEIINDKLAEIAIWIITISIFLGVFKIVGGTLALFGIFGPMILYTIYAFASGYILTKLMGYELYQEDEA